MTLVDPAHYLRTPQPDVETTGCAEVVKGGGWGLGAGARAGLCRLSPPRRSDTASSDTGGDTPSSAPAPRTAAAVGTSGSSV